MDKYHSSDSQSRVPKWIYPWDLKVHNDIAHDDRFFSLVIRSLLSYLDSTIRLYGKPVRHFIMSTGTEYLYQESNGYYFSMSETSGEDYIYMEKPRCTIEWTDVQIIQNDVASPYSRGLYERPVWNEVNECIEYRAFSGEIKFIPIKMPITLRYVLSNFNESIILTQEMLQMFMFTRYFAFTYMGTRIDCSVEFPLEFQPTNQIKLDYSAESKDRHVDIKIDLKTTMPVVMDQTEVRTTDIIRNMVNITELSTGNNSSDVLITNTTNDELDDSIWTHWPDWRPIIPAPSEFREATFTNSSKSKGNYDGSREASVVIGGGTSGGTGSNPEAGTGGNGTGGNGTGGSTESNPEAGTGGNTGGNSGGGNNRPIKPEDHKFTPEDRDRIIDDLKEKYPDQYDKIVKNIKNYEIIELLKKHYPDIYDEIVTATSSTDPDVMVPYLKEHYPDIYDELIKMLVRIDAPAVYKWATIETLKKYCKENDLTDTDFIEYLVQEMQVLFRDRLYFDIPARNLFISKWYREYYKDWLKNQYGYVQPLRNMWTIQANKEFAEYQQQLIDAQLEAFYAIQEAGPTDEEFSPVFLSDEEHDTWISDWYNNNYYTWFENIIKNRPDIMSSIYNPDSQRFDTLWRKDAYEAWDTYIRENPDVSSTPAARGTWVAQWYAKNYDTWKEQMYERISAIKVYYNIDEEDTDFCLFNEVQLEAIWERKAEQLWEDEVDRRGKENAAYLLDVYRTNGIVAHFGSLNSDYTDVSIYDRWILDNYFQQ